MFIFLLYSNMYIILYCIQKDYRYYIMKYTWISFQWYSCYGVCLCYLDMHYVFCLRFHLSFCLFYLPHLSLFRIFNRNFTWPWKMLCYTDTLQEGITIFHIQLLKFVKVNLNLSLEIVTNWKSDHHEGKEALLRNCLMYWSSEPRCPTLWQL